MVDFMKATLEQGSRISLRDPHSLTHSLTFTSRLTRLHFMETEAQLALGQWVLPYTFL